MQFTVYRSQLLLAIRLEVASVALPGAPCRQDSPIRSRTSWAETWDRSTRRPTNASPLRQIPLYALGFSASNSLAFASGKLTVMPLRPASTPRKLLPATLNDAILRAARTGGPSSTCGRARAIARILASVTILMRQTGDLGGFTHLFGCTGSTASSLSASRTNAANAGAFASLRVLSFAIRLEAWPSRMACRAASLAPFQNPTETNVVHTPIVMTSPRPWNVGAPYLATFFRPGATERIVFSAASATSAGSSDFLFTRYSLVEQLKTFAGGSGLLRPWRWASLWLIPASSNCF